MLDRKIEHDELPACVECGECFTNWNRILTELKNATELKVTPRSKDKSFVVFMEARTYCCTNALNQINTICSFVVVLPDIVLCNLVVDDS